MSKEGGPRGGVMTAARPSVSARIEGAGFRAPTRSAERPSPRFGAFDIMRDGVMPFTDRARPRGESVRFAPFNPILPASETRRPESPKVSLVKAFRHKTPTSEVITEKFGPKFEVQDKPFSFPSLRTRKPEKLAVQAVREIIPIVGLPSKEKVSLIKPQQAPEKRQDPIIQTKIREIGRQKDEVQAEKVREAARELWPNHSEKLNVQYIEKTVKSVLEAKKAPRIEPFVPKVQPLRREDRMTQIREELQLQAKPAVKTNKETRVQTDPKIELLIVTDPQTASVQKNKLKQDQEVVGETKKKVVKTTEEQQDLPEDTGRFYFVEDDKAKKVRQQLVTDAVNIVFAEKQFITGEAIARYMPRKVPEAAKSQIVKEKGRDGSYGGLWERIAQMKKTYSKFKAWVSGMDAIEETRPVELSSLPYRREATQGEIDLVRSEKEPSGVLVSSLQQ